MANITYDLEQLEEAKKAIGKLAEKLSDDNKQLTEMLATLEQEWNTDAGKKFFKEHKDTWSKYVEKYVQKITGVKDMLQNAIDIYEQIDNEVSNLKI